ncbi:L-threonylcarbamoyladenylate synthase [Thermosporothrix hazakensis]|jgi:L-threonylcarbamoyladenylate synthase|uniref:Threonylcarbamoyl-AMP synthase n=2 Tax=Thermosporothrix TaxID=768650 RepID=A0A326UBR9_THEHA|nr:L-threonylcarbamoyladenylate synthase [Thermosporothrix hazakensis]PZW36062.1 L-threonylcarbamoyladenylate synthase [Thermosporothrix hazakensis]BBH88528.1 threonylcarbamoyl-AMP synthase [Thermosporothrix sp. COM3]GCE46713.1 threonylcarbamoyl-AMP synthase [Thermosporothrix hazakensis]
MADMYQTEVIPLDPAQPDAAIIERAATILRGEDVVVFPTETVYGLGADVFRPKAVERIFAAKERPYSDPLIAHIIDEQMLVRLTASIPPLVHELARHFWPGPLTLILPAAPEVPRTVTAGLDTVAVRMPSHPIARALIRAMNSPIAAPSANRFMHVSPTTAQHVYQDLAGRVPLILDAGPCAVGVESTILDLCAEVPTILRPGGVSLEALQAVLPDVQVAKKRPTADEGTAMKSPGQMLIHYSPHVPAYLFEGSDEQVRAAMQREAARYSAQGKQVGVLIATEDIVTFQHSGLHSYAAGSLKAPEEVAARLFAGLRTLEDAGVDVILCRNFPEKGLGRAVRDRLLKATGGKIISA